MSLPPSPKAPGGGDPDPSMDDILASIRRILDDDQVVKEPSADVLMLDTSMMVENGSGGGAAPDAGASERAPTPSSGMTSHHEDLAPADHTTDAAAAPAAEPVQAEPVAPSPVVVLNERNTMASLDDDAAAVSTMPRAAASLVAPAAAAAAANSVGALMRTLAAERSAVVNRGGATIEDIVREEMKPFLKEWLDTHLPPIVERLVQVEIERLVARQAG